jgi:hypothetical protein
VNYVQAAYKLILKAKEISHTYEYVIATKLALKYNQRKLLDEQANHVKKLVLLQAEERKVEVLAKTRDRFLRVVEKQEKLYEEVLEMRVDYVSDDDDRELTYYEQMEADYDEVMIQCEYCMHILVTDIEANAKQPRKLKRGYNLYEWIEQELPGFRDEYKQGGAFVDIDEMKRLLIDTVHGHIMAVIHPGDSYEEGCIDYLVYRRWAEADEQEWLDEQAETWLAEHVQDPAGMALRAAETPMAMDVDDMNQCSAWVAAHPEEMAIKYWQEVDQESTAAEFWGDLHPDIPEDQEIEAGSGIFGTNTECSDLVLKVRENRDFYEEAEILQAEAWARACPDEILTDLEHQIRDPEYSVSDVWGGPGACSYVGACCFNSPKQGEYRPVRNGNGRTGGGGRCKATVAASRFALLCSAPLTQGGQCPAARHVNRKFYDLLFFG